MAITRAEDIQGWFTWAWLYDWASRNVRPSGGSKGGTPPLFVEVGVWKGRSIAHLAQALLATGRPFKLFGVDTWSMQPSGPANAGLDEHLAELHARGSDLWREYDANLRALGLREVVQDCRCPSVQAAERIGHADFVFIDGDHSAEAVAEDVRAWAPRAGILCGHDAYQPSVQEGLRRARLSPSGCPRGYFLLPMLNVWTTHQPLADAWSAGLEESAGRIVEAFERMRDEQAAFDRGAESGSVGPLVGV